MSKQRRRQDAARAKNLAIKRILSTPSIEHWIENPRRVGLMTNTRKRCSCEACGNARQNCGPTRQEELAALSAREQMKIANLSDEARGG